MITESVIKEIYKKFCNPEKDMSKLQIDRIVDMLSSTHRIRVERDEIILDDLEECNPFRRFLIRRLCAILEFDKSIAFVLCNYILFVNKADAGVNIHFKAEPKRTIWQRIFCRR